MNSAIRTGDLEKVRELIAGGDVNEIDQFGYTLLSTAARENQIDIVRFLLEAGANPNQMGTDENMTTPLYFAIRNRDPDIVKVLLEAGADVNQEANGMSPLTIVIVEARGDIDLLRMLLNKGANVNIQDSRGGFTPLHFAANKGYPEAVKMLLDAGADKTILTHYGQSVRDFARKDEIRSILDTYIGTINKAGGKRNQRRSHRKTRRHIKKRRITRRR